ncbi:MULTISPECIES: phosphatase PAP2 family protein [Paraburkholderia]|uniref:Phosphatase PAP2 family protein n=1 Tax=Paraburkholderia madseniana TaxID=2599607 RepID=A0AAP5ETL2_9BURK|nr:MULTISPECIES: phosphatase PAP2 family protein [Paraburkholderia]MCX4151401.1 phosphatase PAP2 family protein [Paraburkholderia madseniana]MDN7154332.1 phosphatase PAP2 family protein [Paraburkholderia sp. WS6]MDQ6413214.1 phosphatase PAP2 family protein [Paraburkholderia madseniana]
MNSFDTAILAFLTHNAFSSDLINHAIRVIADLYTFKGLVLIPILWWMWFKPSQHGEWEREMVIATIVGGLLALAIGRLLADYLPFRVRPIYNPELHLHFPSASLRDVRTWSSFPSDHAMLWMSVATGIFLVWRRVGVLALLYTAIFICMPRVYLGLHYPTDILAGAAIGIIITYVMTRDSVRTRFAVPILGWIQRFPGGGYTLAFLLCFELITQSVEIRLLEQSVSKAVRLDGTATYGPGNHWQ